MTFYSHGVSAVSIKRAEMSTSNISAIALISISVAMRTCPSNFERLLGLISTPLTCICATSSCCFIPRAFRNRSIFAPHIFFVP